MNAFKAYTGKAIIILAPLIVIGGYFQYQTGFFHYYEIPPELLHIPFVVWLFSACALLAALGTVRLFPVFFLTVTRYPLLLLVPLALLIFCRYAGYYSASAKITYIVSVTHPNFIVVKQYPDLLILKSYDPKTHLLGLKLLVEGIHSGRNEQFEFHNTGKLEAATP